MAEPFNADEVVREGYFINESERDTGNPANDAGKVPQLEANGKLSRKFIPAWALFETFPISGSPATIVFDNLDGFEEVMLVFDNVVLSASTAIRLNFSQDNGSTYLTTNKYSTGGSFNSSDLAITAGTSTPNTSAILHSLTSSHRKPVQSGASFGMVDSSAPVNAVKLLLAGTATFNSGTVYVYVR